MTPDQIDRVFGRGRLKMVTGDHVEVFREAVLPGERRRYTKRFLDSTEGDFAQWTEREWRILARLIGHGITCVPDVVQFDRGSGAGRQLVQTYDAGVTVDQWATLLPLRRDGRLYRHAFEDCAHWWALAHHCLVALKEIHQLQLVHLDVKGDNVCIPFGPANFDPDAPAMTLRPMFADLALIDFAFALVSRESLDAPLPIGWQREYDYQSPRLLKALEAGHDGDLGPTRELDWRCDMYSLAAMLKRYLPDDAIVHQPEPLTGWTGERFDAAKALILALRDHHDRDAPQLLPHPALIEVTGAQLHAQDLALSLSAGWTLARDVNVVPAGASPLTPMTRLAPPLRVLVSPRDRVATPALAAVAPRATSTPHVIRKRNVAARPQVRRAGVAHAALAAALIFALGAVAADEMFPDATRTWVADARSWLDGMTPRADSAASSSTRIAGESRSDPVAPEDATPSAAAPSATSGTQSGVRDDRVAESSATPDAESSVAAAPPSTRDSVAASDPPVSRTSPKAPTYSGDAVRAAGKRTTTKPTQTPSTRLPAQVAAAKLPPASRSLLQARRASPATPGSRSNSGPVRLPGETPDPATAPTQLSQMEPNQPAAAPSPARRETPEIALPLAQQPSTDATAPTASNVSQVAQPSPGPEQRASTTPSEAPTPRRNRAPSTNDNRAAETGGFFSQLFGLTKQRPAPIEDRTLQAGASTDKAPRAPQKASPPQDRVVVASVVAAPLAVSPKVEIARPAPSAPSIISTAQAEVPATVPSGPPPSAPPPPVREAPRAPSPPLFTEARVESAAPDRIRGDYATQARRSLAQTVPRIAAQTQIEIARVLWLAGNAYDPRLERAVVDSAQAVSVRDSASGLFQSVVEPGAARRLNDDAMQAYWVRRNVAEAFDLELRAFGANPLDPEIAGNLAFLHLKVSPPQAETARQLALHAIAVRGARYRSGRVEDWNTYAVASALTGRDADARNAMFVTVALAGSIEQNCKAARNAIANYGERLREPSEAMLYRIHTQGRAYESPYCAWPTTWAAGMRVH